MLTSAQDFAIRASRNSYILLCVYKGAERCFEWCLNKIVPWKSEKHWWIHAEPDSQMQIANSPAALPQIGTFFLYLLDVRVLKCTFCVRTEEAKALKNLDFLCALWAKTHLIPALFDCLVHMFFAIWTGITDQCAAREKLFCHHFTSPFWGRRAKQTSPAADKHQMTCCSTIAYLDRSMWISVAILVLQR